MFRKPGDGPTPSPAAFPAPPWGFCFQKKKAVEFLESLIGMPPLVVECTPWCLGIMCGSAGDLQLVVATVRRQPAVADVMLVQGASMTEVILVKPGRGGGIKLLQQFADPLGKMGKVYGMPPSA